MKHPLLEIHSDDEPWQATAAELILAYEQRKRGWKSWPEQQYWQGRADATRVLLAMHGNDDKAQGRVAASSHTNPEMPAAEREFLENL